MTCTYFLFSITCTYFLFSITCTYFLFSITCTYFLFSTICTYCTSFFFSIYSPSSIPNHTFFFHKIFSLLQYIFSLLHIMSSLLLFTIPSLRFCFMFSPRKYLRRYCVDVLYLHSVSHYSLPLFSLFNPQL